MSQVTHRKYGWVKGQHLRFVVGHRVKTRKDDALRETDYKVDEGTGCWNWTGAVGAYGYGISYYHGHLTHAHRMAYQSRRGPIPKGMILDHLCRNKLCVNPDHLEPVSNAVNTQRGDAAKLTEADVIEIRRLYRSGGWTHRSLATRFGVCRENVGRIIRNQQWKNVA